MAVTISKILPALLVFAASLVFSVLMDLYDAVIGFSYGEVSTFARIGHDVGLMLWGGVLMWLARPSKKESIPTP